MSRLFKTEVKGNVHHHTFQSVSDFVETAKASGYKRYADSFTNHVSFDGALELVEKGWKGGYSDVVKGVSGMVGRMDSAIDEDLVPSMAGPLFNMDSIFSGQPDCYFDFETIEDHKPVVKLGCQFSAQGMYDQIHFRNRGSAVLSLIEVLEMMNIPVELWGYANTIRRDGKTQRIDVLMKTSHEPLDSDKIAFILSHAGFYRQIGFGVKEYLSKYLGESFGLPGNCQSTEINANHDFDIVTPYSREFLSDTNTIKKWISETCSNIGLETSFNQ